MQIKECEGKLAGISQYFIPQSLFASNCEDQVMVLLDKIKSLNQEKDRIIGRVGELWNLIAPRLDTLLRN